MRYAVQQGRVPNRRLRLLWNLEMDLSPEVRVAANLLRTLATRIGAVPQGSVMPGCIRRQRWSPFNVPLMWAAAEQVETCPVFEWLTSIAGRVDEPVPVFGGNTSASEAVRTGWAALRFAFRCWGVNSDVELSGWLSRNGFPATRPGHHISGRAQEFILTSACREDARVALLEVVFVVITLNEGRNQTPAEGDVVPPIPRASIGGTGIPTSVPRDSWEQLDNVDLEEVFLRRTPMLRSCPHFLRGRVRHCFTVTLGERSRAKVEGDIVGEERAWKAFALIPLMILNRPRGLGSIGKQELVGRANKFARGQWFELLEGARQALSSTRRVTQLEGSEELRRRGFNACTRVKQGQISRISRSITGHQEFGDVG